MKELKVEKYIQDTFKLLNARAQNALLNTLNEITFAYIKEKILFNDNFEIHKIRNIGNGTVDILKKYFLDLENFINQISESETDIKKDDLTLKISIESLFDEILIDEDLIKKRNHFEIINLIIESNQFLNEKEKMIFKSNLNFITDEEKLTLTELTKKINLSRERIRQIKVQILEKLNEKFHFIKLFNDDFLNVYNIDKNDLIISLSNDQTNRLNELFNIKYTNQFHTFILYLILDDSYSLIGDIEDVFSVFERVNDLSHHNWNNLFLMKNEINSTFDFKAFVNDVYHKINENSSEGYKFHIKSYLSNFLKIDDYKILSNIIPLCEEILEKEFNIILDLNECIVFERTKAKTVPEFALEALEKIGKPAHISEITNCVREMYPDFSKIISGSNLNNRSIFTYFGRSSIYGLVKWESEKENIKGGTIKDFVIKYLQNKTSPIHIFELYTEVVKYRNDTYIKSIIDNLKAKPGNKNFVFYHLGFIGLKDLENSYDTKYNQIPLMLTKTITGKVRTNIFKTKDDIQTFLTTFYNLTNKESMNYINYLEITETLVL